VAKIALDAGLTCPNRDGSISRAGCLFCDAKGSGTGWGTSLSLAEQIAAGKARSRNRADRYICYFQSYTNTYAPLERLQSMWDLAISEPDTVGLAVGTRPDCLPDEVLDVLAGYRAHEVWLELGLQSSNDETLRRINRGHTAGDFADACLRARKRGLKVVAHVILGLPGEDGSHYLETARFLTDAGVDGVKIHSLYVSRDAGLAEVFRRGDLKCLSREEFVDSAVRFLENIPADVVIHRLTGDPDPDRLVAPEWARDKGRTIQMIRKRLDDLDTWQGAALGAPPYRD
jgi:radical SAM protein (TIGR01212 family)